MTVTSRTLEQAGRPRQSPPGYAIGDAVLEGEWIDSPTALAAARAAGAEALVTRPGAAIAALLVLSDPRWIIRVAAQGQTREWQVDASDGTVSRDPARQAPVPVTTIEREQPL